MRRTTTILSIFCLMGNVWLPEKLQVMEATPYGPPTLSVKLTEPQHYK